MLVRAKLKQGQYGFYGDKRRYDGDEFMLTDAKHFSKSWMEEVEQEKSRKPLKRKEGGL